MKAKKRARLTEAGWTVGETADFLRLTPEESTFVDMKVALSRSLRQWRAKRQLTQAELARALSSSQSRIAKMEAADPTVSVDLLVRSLLKLGATRRDIARALT